MSKIIDNRLDPYDIIHKARYEISKVAAAAGIDWEATEPRLNDSKGGFKCLPIERKYKGSVKAWLQIKTAKSGQQYPVINFHTPKNGGITESFNGWQWLESNGYTGGKKETHATLSAAPIPPAPATGNLLPPAPAKLAPVKACTSCGQTFAPAKNWFIECPDCFSDEGKLKRFNEKHDLFNQLPKLAEIKERQLFFKGNYLAKFFSRYLKRKGFTLDDLISTGLDIRHGVDKRGRFVIYPLKNAQGETTGYQSIYDKKFIGYDDELRDKDFCVKPNSKNGSFAILGNFNYDPVKLDALNFEIKELDELRKQLTPATDKTKPKVKTQLNATDKEELARIKEELAELKDKKKEVDISLYFVEGAATGLTVFLATGKPVIVCLDAGNLSPAMANFSHISKKYIAADNDIRTDNNGNAGIFSALQAARTHNARIFIPLLPNGKKCDYNDLMLLQGIAEVTRQLSPRDNPNELKFNKENYQAILFKYAPANQLKGVAGYLCFQAAKKVITLTDFKQQSRAVQAVFNTREFKEFKATRGIYNNGFKELIADIKRDNFFTDSAGIVENIDVTSLTFDEIAETTEGLQGLLIDDRGMGQRKTQNMGKVTANIRAKEAAEKALTLISDNQRKAYFLRDDVLTLNEWHTLKGNAENFAIWQRLNDDEKIKAWLNLLPAEDKIINYACHREGLTANGANTTGLDYYKTAPFDSNGVATCINSIGKFKQPHVLFDDEARQSFEHVLNGSCDNRLAVFNLQAEWVTKSNLTVLADADMNQATFDYFSGLAKAADKKIYRLVTSKKGKHGKKVHLLNGIDAVILKAIEVLTANPQARLWLAADSVIQVHKAATALSNHLGLEEKKGIETAPGKHEKTGVFINGAGKDVLLIATGENKGNTQQKAFLEKPDTESANYQIIIHSPVISSGVSITTSFDFVGAIFTGVIQPNEMLQTLARVRTATDIFIGFSSEVSRDKPCNRADLAKGYEVQQFMINPKSGKVELSEFDQLRLNHIAASNKASNNWQQYLLILLQMKDYTVTQDKTAAGELDITAIETKAEIAKNVLEAKAINETAAEYLEKANDTTQDETYAIKRFNAVKMTGKLDNQLTLEDVNLFLHDRGLSKLQNFELVKAGKDDYQTAFDRLQAKDLENQATRQKLASDSVKTWLFSWIVNALIGKPINNSDVKKCLDFLHKNHQLLAINNIGNYSNPSTNARTLTNFLEKIGYELAEIGQESSGARQRIYELQANTLIAEYAANRQRAREFAAACNYEDESPPAPAFY